MINELAPLDAELSGLLSQLDSKARRQLMRDIAKELRASQQQRIASQHNPDGTAYAARKPQKLRGKQGKVRRQMFGKIKLAKWLKAQSSPDRASIVFVNSAQRLAQVHQFGLRDRVNRGKPLEVDYPVRELLGATDQDMEMIRERVINHLAR